MSSSSSSSFKVVERRRVRPWHAAAPGAREGGRAVGIGLPAQGCDGGAGRGVRAGGRPVPGPPVLGARPEDMDTPGACTGSRRRARGPTSPARPRRRWRPRPSCSRLATRPIRPDCCGRRKRYRRHLSRMHRAQGLTAEQRRVLSCVCIYMQAFDFADRYRGSYNDSLSSVACPSTAPTPATK
jgi:hypothetical protein